MSSSDAKTLGVSPDEAPQKPRTGEVHFEKWRGVSEVRLVPGMAHVTVTFSENGADSATARLVLLDQMARCNVPVFLVKMLPGGVSFALRSDDIEAGRGALQELEVPFETRENLALVSIYAGAMRDLSGVMADIYEALLSANVRVIQTGDAYNAVHCLVSQSRAHAAQNVLRRKFSLPESAPDSVSLESGPVPMPAL